MSAMSSVNYAFMNKEELLQMFDNQEVELNRIFRITSKSLAATSGDKPLYSRYWNKDEHFKFLVCIAYLNATKCKGLPVMKIAQYVTTRTPIQIRTHAQKYFEDKHMLSHTTKEVSIKMKEDYQILKKIFGHDRMVMNYRLFA